MKILIMFRQVGNAAHANLFDTKVFNDSASIEKSGRYCCRSHDSRN